MPELYALLQRYLPEGATPTSIANLADVYLEEILADLPRIDSLPMPDKLREAKINTWECPVVIEEAISIGALQRHLSKTTPDTPEIGITVFGSNTQVFEVGTVNSVSSHPSWKPLRERAAIDFHTHPGPDRAEYMRNPSLNDVTHAIILGQSIAIGSWDGLTHVPAPKVKLAEHTGHTLWYDYFDDRGFDTSYEAYGPERAYTDFVRDVLESQFSLWSQLDEDATLTDSIISQRQHF